MIYDTKFGKFYAESQQQLDEFLMKETRNECKRLLHTKCDLKLSALALGYPVRETQTWSVQLEEAKAYLSDSASPTPFISAALNDGETVEQYAHLIVENNTSWSDYAGDVVKFRRKYEKTINDATTINGLELIIEELNNALI